MRSSLSPGAITRLGMLACEVCRKTFNDSAVVDGWLAIAAKSGAALAEPAIVASTAWHDLHQASASR